MTNAAYEGTGGEPADGTVGTVGTDTTGPTTTSPADGTETADSGGDPPELCITDDDCADDVFCNGVEACDSASPLADERGCVPGTNPCPPENSCLESREGCLACEEDVDFDDDTFISTACGGDDCNDDDANINPEAEEVCNLLDEDCDPTTVGGEDLDGDGEVSFECCNPTDVGPKCGGDCDDDLIGITGPGTDWAHCIACDQGCDPLQACFVGGVCMPARRVFVTSETSNGNLGGLEGADARCQEHAESMALEGTWRALLIDGEVGLSRLEHADVPYVRLDGQVIAASWADLVDGSIAHPLFVDEQRNVWDGFTDRAWTGLPTLTGGAEFDAHCAGWTSSAEGCPTPKTPCGVAGDVSAVTEDWAAPGFGVDCSFVHHLYCIEQMVPG